MFLDTCIYIIYNMGKDASNEKKARTSEKMKWKHLVKEIKSETLSPVAIVILLLYEQTEKQSDIFL